MFYIKKNVFLQSEISQSGAIAQSVEQRTENPCVTGSIPVSSTKTLVDDYFARVYL